MFEKVSVDVRLLHRLNSPKRGGSSDIDSQPYLKALGVTIHENRQPIQFTDNINERIHRWAPYVQGFSASFVQSQIDQYIDEYDHPVIYDPFAGCGTVLVQAKLNELGSYGTELNPLLQFIANTKLNSWSVRPGRLRKIYDSLSRDHLAPVPEHLKTEKHFPPGVLANLRRLKGGINRFEPSTREERKIKDLLLLAFSAILIDSSTLKRAPCLGYAKNKRLEDSTPFVLMNKKIEEIAEDLHHIRSHFKDAIHVRSEVYLANAMTYAHKGNYDIVITSPPYMNGLDYVMNYKIEMSWLGFASNHRDLKQVKDEMVVCDNVSKGLIREFAQSHDVYTNEWIEDIKTEIAENIARRGSYRRKDMPFIVHKYFDDMYRVMKNVVTSLNPGGRFILVVGDSLIADTYVPTDLLIARIGVDLGLTIEKIEKARTRRSGQIRSYKLRESIVTLQKP